MIAPELTATIFTLILPLPLSEGSRVRHLLRLTLRIALTIDLFAGRFGPVFLAGLLPRFKVLLGDDLPRRIPLSKLVAADPFDFDEERDLDVGDFLRLFDARVVLRLSRRLTRRFGLRRVDRRLLFCWA